MNWIKLLIIGTIALSLSSCGGVKSKAEDMAEDTCDCMKDAGGVDEMIGGGLMTGRGGMQDDMQDCMKDKAEEYIDYLSNLDSDDKKEFIKEYVKALVETDCADDALDKVTPFMDMALKKAKKELGGKSSESLSMGGPDFCDCVKLDNEGRDADDRDEWEEENKDMIEECEELAEEWQDEYQDASDEEQKEMQKKVMDCM